MAALAVAGCGRKGPLDPPPSISAAPQPEQQRQQSGLPSFGTGQPPEPESQRTVLGARAGIDSTGAAVAPAGEKKRIPLDVLID
jgi:predicted small lipoprotein YifL